MVKVHGPMMSLDASGSLNKSIVFSKWKGRNYARGLVKPSNPRSGGQVGRRAMMRFLAQIWTYHTAAYKATWQPLADQLVASPFNAFMSANMKRWHNYIAPSQQADPTEVGAESDDTLSAAAWEENRIKLSSEITALNDGWGTIIFASPTPAFTPAVGNAILVLKHWAVTTYEEFWTPPVVSAWSFNIRAFSNDGVLGAATGEQTAAAP